jgi:hypothetical protein
MKIQSRTSRLITGVTVVCALAIATTASAKNPKTVLLEISNNKLIMKTKKGENGCEATFGEYRKNGCIQLIKKETSDIHFKLKENTRCTPLDSGTTWELNAVYLGGFNSSSKPPKNGYGFANTSPADFDKVNEDFNGVDKASGLVTSADIKPKKITIHDKNAHKYKVWYKIEAICKREDGGKAHTIYYDPRVKNGGND